jgi:hypothetical protein
MSSKSVQIPWYYMWSQKYAFFHHILQDDMKEYNLNLEPIFLDQSVFDSNLYKDEGKHAWNGFSLKIDLLIERLKTAQTNGSPYILFTDVDIIVKPGIYDRIKPYIESNTSMVFLKEGEHLNIGFILLKVCPEVLSFWELVKAKMVEEPNHDQLYVNQLIGEYPGTWTTFDNQRFTCSNIWDGNTPFVVMQPLSSCLGKEFDFAEKVFYAAQYTNIEPYMKHVPQDIVPFIYRFQEILIRSHQQAKK